ncbi:MAG: hypothetical protein GY953_29525, partial [bacterium]|nr:hypothetical protein [bacterium]
NNRGNQILLPPLEKALETMDEDGDGRISADEIRYMMNIVGTLFPDTTERKPISAFSSLRPLVESGESSATKTSREHRIWNSGSGVLHVAGGKYTTYRAMAEEATNLLAEELFPDLLGRCSTATEPVGGNSADKLEGLRESCAELAGRFNLDAGDVEYLARDFGVLAPAVLDLAPETPANGLSRLDSALIAYTVKHEMVCRLADLLFV